MTREERHAAYMEAYQLTGPIGLTLPSLGDEREEALPTAEWFALNAAHHALTTLMDALVVLHELAKPEEGNE